MLVMMDLVTRICVLTSFFLSFFSFSWLRYGPFGEESMWGWVDPGVFALVGAASFFGGVSRLTISLTVIMVEITNDVQMLVGCGCVAQDHGSLWHRGGHLMGAVSSP